MRRARWPSSTSRCRPGGSLRAAGRRSKPPHARGPTADPPPPAHSPLARQLGGAGGALTEEEKAEILDGQALHIRGAILRLTGHPAEAGDALAQALARLSAVRRGRVASVSWMEAQIMSEQAALAESAGRSVEAERLHRAGLA